MSKKYRNFSDYLQQNYLENINGALVDYIEEKELTGKVYDDERYINAYHINSIRVTGVKFIKSEIDNVEFIVHLLAEYDLIEAEDDELIKTYPTSKSFLYKMSGSFKDGFIGRKNKEIEITNDEVAENLTSGLVPIIHKDELDNYASKFLKKYCPEALQEPTKINLLKLMKEINVTYYYANLEPGVLGKTYFANDTIEIVDENEKTKIIDVSPGTIIIDIDKHLERNEGAFRNTVIHELVHWHFHRNYFELMQCLDKEKTHVVCKNDDKRCTDKDIYWMEWQARNLAPRILAPKKQAIIEIKELKEKILSENKTLPNSEKEKKLVELFANSFGLSTQSAKIRLRELGETRADGVYNFMGNGYGYREPFFFKSGFLEINQTFILNKESYMRLLKSDTDIGKAIVKGELVYVDGLLVVNNPKYVDLETLKLTEYGKEHTHECCMVFDVFCDNCDDFKKDPKKAYFLLSTGRTSNTLATPNTSQLEKILVKADKNLAHFFSHKDQIPSDFGGTFEYHYKKTKEKYQNLIKICKIEKRVEDIPVDTITSYASLAFESDVNEKYLNDYKNNNEDNKPTKTNIIKLSLAMKLSMPYKDYLNTIIQGYEDVGLDIAYLVEAIEDTKNRL